MHRVERIKHFIHGTRADATTPPPYLLSVRSSKWFILSTICVAVFTDIFLYGIIVPVIPYAISERAGVGESDVQKWVSVLLAVYGAALLVMSPLSGWYADRSSSRRLPLLFGLLALSGATVMLCLARTVALLVVGRLFQGLAAAIIWTVGVALLVDTVGQKEIGQTLGYVSISLSVGVLLAPLLGGIVYDKAGYYAVFAMAFGLLALDIFCRLVLIEKKIALQWDEAAESNHISAPASSDARNAIDAEKEKSQGQDLDPVHTDEEKSRFPDPNLDESITPETAYNGQSLTEQTPPTISKPKYPAVFTLLASRRLLAALCGCIVQGSLMTAFDSVIPLFVQRTFHWNSVGAGLVFLALVLPSLLAPVVGWVSDHFGPRWLTVGGFIFAIPFWILLRLVDHDSLRQKVLLCALLALIDVGLTLVLGPLLAEITYVVEAKEKERPGRYGANGAYAQAYGLFIAAFATGTLIGPIWAGYVEDTAGWGTMAWSLGLFSLAGAVPCLFWTGGWIFGINAKSGDERAIGRAAIVARNDEEMGNGV